MGDDSVILFGSAARGDTTSESDIDLLVVSSKGHARSKKFGRIEIQMNTRHAMMEKSRQGDLFAIHIALEGVAISDNENFLPTFRQALVVRKSYAKEREMATVLASYLLQVSLDVDQLLRCKRIAWCVRTILISMLVESGRYIFSPTGLVSAFPELNVAPLIALRRQLEIADLETINRQLEKFLHSVDGDVLLNKDLASLRSRIQSFGPSTAFSTMVALERNSGTFAY